MTGVMHRVKRIADAMSADSPDRFVATVINSKRKGRIRIDYLRNGRASTAVAPYSTRGLALLAVVIAASRISRERTTDT